MSIGPAKPLLGLLLGTLLLAPPTGADNRVLDLAIGDPDRTCALLESLSAQKEAPAASAVGA